MGCTKSRPLLASKVQPGKKGASSARGRIAHKSSRHFRKMFGAKGRSTITGILLDCGDSLCPPPALATNTVSSAQPQPETLATTSCPAVVESSRPFSRYISQSCRAAEIARLGPGQETAPPIYTGAHQSYGYHVDDDDDDDDDGVIWVWPRTSSPHPFSPIQERDLKTFLHSFRERASFDAAALQRGVGNRRTPVRKPRCIHIQNIKITWYYTRNQRCLI